VKDFFHYFFGQGETVEFRNFTFAHLAPILVAALIIVAIYLLRDRLRDSTYDKPIRFTLAFVAIISEMSYYWRLVGVPSLEPNPIDHLPIAVCGWVAIFCSYLAVTKSQSLFDFIYFWLFSGCLFALITPTVISYTGPTRFRYYQFWAEHTIGYITIFYMMFVHKMRPTIRSAIKSFSLLAVLGVVAYTANRILGPGANYLFLARPEDTPSVLDILPPNFALRLTVMAAVIVAMFALAYLPWYLKDRKAKKQAAAQIEP
jgi:hypothetical integral membrane protein (TIGR02206 family)